MKICDVKSASGGVGRQDQILTLRNRGNCLSPTPIGNHIADGMDMSGQIERYGVVFFDPIL